MKLTRLHCARDSPGTHPGVGCHSLLEGIFLSQGSNPRLSCLLQWQVDSLHLSHRGSPLNLVPAMCTEAAAVPGVETGQQIPLSLDLHWPIKYLPSQAVQTVALHVSEVKRSVLQSHPPCFKCSVASCGQVPGCWTEQMFEKSCHHQQFYWTFHARSLSGSRENTCPREALHVLCESIDICTFCLFCFLSPKPRI